MTEKTSATVITGFLGSGKTTLVRHLLQNANGRRIALIVNEFGDIGVDGEILKSCGQEACREGDMIELANGCICCTVADDFIPTMSKLLARPDRLDHIIIETSGLALPQPLVRAFNWPEIKSRVTVDGVVTVVDGKALAEGRFADDEEAIAASRAADTSLDHENPIQELFEDQLNCADLVILNKVDLLNDAEINSVEASLRQQMRPQSKLIQSTQSAVGPDVILGLKADAAVDLANRQSHHEMEGETQHDHDDFISFIVELPDTVPQGTLLERVSTTSGAHAVLRLKGFAALPGVDARLLIQAVGARVNSYFDRVFKPDEARITRLVVIGEKTMDQLAIEAALKGH